MASEMTDRTPPTAELDSLTAKATRRYLPPGHFRDDDPADDYADVSAKEVDWDMEDEFLDGEEVVVRR
ncbi:hypothetical protein IV500_06625 [Paeniglutamicibacter antarcticus]|uniref:Uncharacterized protein n=1 Tax=Arthrobacter terrae TaxID=2935737 RepID=A0A931CSR0_9MICC|nr:hypothetical protein [Arthrobacter terrae]MBG0739073.1 hypothetical protein [Arthrobacter terrae]